MSDANLKNDKFFYEKLKGSSNRMISLDLL